jgi:hypothetical protein
LFSLSPLLTFVVFDDHLRTSVALLLTTQREECTLTAAAAAFEIGQREREEREKRNKVKETVFFRSAKSK